jgi:hypothetical protein
MAAETIENANLSQQDVTETKEAQPTRMSCAPLLS